MPHVTESMKKHEIELELTEEQLALIDRIGRAEGFKNRSEVVSAALHAASRILKLADDLKKPAE